jgi:cobalt ECF transporter T component CbiQ
MEETMIPDWLTSKGTSAAPCPCCRAGLTRQSFTERTLAGIQRLLHSLFLSEESAKAPGFLQRADPRLKLFVLLAGLVASTLVRDLRLLALLYSLTLALALGSRLPMGLFLLRTWAFIPLFTLIMVLPAIFSRVTPGNPVLVLFHGLVITRQGLWTVALLVLRTATAVSWTLLLIMTTRWNRLLAALEILKLPRPILLALTMMVRYLYVVVREAEEMHYAIQSRTLHHPRPRAGQKVATASLGALFRKSLGWIEEIYQAMVARGYEGP